MPTGKTKKIKVTKKVPYCAHWPSEEVVIVRDELYERLKRDKACESA